MTEGYKQLVHAGDLIFRRLFRYSIKSIQADSQQKTAFMKIVRRVFTRRIFIIVIILGGECEQKARFKAHN